MSKLFYTNDEQRLYDDLLDAFDELADIYNNKDLKDEVAVPKEMKDFWDEL